MLPSEKIAPTYLQMEWLH